MFAVWLRFWLSRLVPFFACDLLNAAWTAGVGGLHTRLSEKWQKSTAELASDAAPMARTIRPHGRPVFSTSYFSGSTHSCECSLGKRITVDWAQEP